MVPEEPVERWRRRLSSRPVTVVACLALAVELAAALRLYGPLEPGEWPVLDDSIIFEYHGWWLARGRRLYIDLWEVKPPVSFEITTVFALLAPDVATYHVLNVAFMAACLVAACALAAQYVADITSDPLAAVVAGLAPLSFAPFYWRGLLGFKAKPLVCVLLLAALVAAARERHALAGALAGLCVGTWQLTAILPVVLFVRHLRRENRTGALRFAGGALLAASVVLAPVVAWGAVPAMVTETLLTPLLAPGGRGTPATRVVGALVRLGPALVVVAIGVAGCVYAAVGERGPVEPALLLAWFGTLLLVDFDAAPDLFVPVVLASVGVGFAVVAARKVLDREAIEPALVALVVVLAVAPAVTVAAGPGTAGTGERVEIYDTDRTLEPDLLLNRTERQYLLWNRVEPPTCRVFVGVTQYGVVKKAELSPPGEPYWNAPCGRFDPVFEAVVETYS